MANSFQPKLKIGDEAPDFTALTSAGGTITLSSLRGKHVILYFYPRDNTPGCTIEACAFRDDFSAFSQQGAVILGVSTDSPKAHDKFSDKYKLPFDLLADADGKVVDAFGVPKAMGFSKRQAFLFKDAKLVWSDLTASTDQQAADVLKFLAEGK